MYNIGALTKSFHVIASQCAHWRTPGWLLLPLRGNSPSGNPVDRSMHQFGFPKIDGIATGLTALAMTCSFFNFT